MIHLMRLNKLRERFTAEFSVNVEEGRMLVLPG